MQPCSVSPGQPTSTWRVQADLANMDKMLSSPDAASAQHRLRCCTTSPAGCAPTSMQGACVSSRREASPGISEGRLPQRFPTLPGAAETAARAGASAGFENALEVAFGQMKAYLLAAHRAARPHIAEDAQHPTQSSTVASATGVQTLLDPAIAADSSQLPVTEILREQLRIQVQLAEVCKVVKEWGLPNSPPNLADQAGPSTATFQSVQSGGLDAASALASRAEPQKDTDATAAKSEKKTSRESTERKNKETLAQHQMENTQSWGQLALDFAPAIVILLNSLVIGLSSDVEPESGFWEGVEIFFTVFFTGEFIVKLRMMGCKQFFLGPDLMWNWFDVFCLGTALSELFMTIAAALFASGGGGDLSGLLLIKMLRLARIMRLVRLLRFKLFAELKKIVQGVVSGIRVLGWAIMLLLFVIFVLGIIFRKLMPGEAEFSTVPHAMFSLFRCFTDGCSAYDGTPLTERLFDKYGALFVIPYSLVYLFVTFGIFNLIMAVFIENVSTEQHSRKLNEIGDNAAYTRAKLERVMTSLFHGEAIDQESFLNMMKDRFIKFPFLSKIIRAIVGPERETERNDIQVVSRDVFREWLENPYFVNLLEDIDIETATKHELFDVLDVNMDAQLEMSEIVDGLMRLRGAVTKSDIVAIRMKIRYMTVMIDDMQMQHSELRTQTDDKMAVKKSESKAQKKPMQSSSSI